MILANEKNIISISISMVYENCIKGYLSKNNEIYMWLPNISMIIVNRNNTTIIQFLNSKDELNLGRTGIEKRINDYINSFYE